MTAVPHRFDVFCRVVDNFGDAGVALRLARQLVAEHAAEVTLWIDDRKSLARIAPGLDSSSRVDVLDGIVVRAMDDASILDRIPEVVIEAFGCGLPERYLDAIEATPTSPVWLNLEYLSAEGWVDGAHGLPSPPPRRALRRWFYFPGFTDATGGLVREHDLVARRDRYLSDSGACAAMWKTPGLPPLADGTLTISLFCYPNDALPALFSAWSDDDDPIVCIVPQGIATTALDRFLGGAVPHTGEVRRVGALTLAVAPFVDQPAFDQRLWCCALNFVRGEDTFVRAQWAARPLVWHAYPQADDAHRAKLDAFADRYGVGLDSEHAGALRRFWRAFNSGDGKATASAWGGFRSALPAFSRHARQWSEQRAARPDLVTQLVAFATSKL